MMAHDNGILTSASLMVHKPAAAQAATLARSRPLLSLGLHIDIGEWRYESGRWAPLYERAPNNDPMTLRAEVVEQVRLFRRLTNGDPTHLDSHQHAHEREPLLSIAYELAVQLGVPLRIPVSSLHHSYPYVHYCGDFYGQDGEGKALPHRLTPYFLTQIIRTLKHEITELCCHPAAELDFRSPYGKERLQELEALCSPIGCSGRQTVASGAHIFSRLAG